MNYLANNLITSRLGSVGRVKATGIGESIMRHDV